MDKASFDLGTRKPYKESNIGPATPAGSMGFAVFMLCVCAALIMLTIKLGMVLFS